MKKTMLLSMVISCALLAIACGHDPGSADNAPGSVMDIEGNVYRTVKIGNQVWMAENLRTTKYSDGSAIPLIKDDEAWFNATEGAYCYYGNTTNPDDIKKFGALYNWYAVNAKKLAPTGWHVPTNADCLTLQDYLMNNGYNWDGSRNGKVSDKIAKSMAAKTDWVASPAPGTVGHNMTKNNKSGFSVLPGGFRGSEGKFYGFGQSSYWWNVAENDTTDLYDRSSIRFDSGGYYRGRSFKSDGFSVRLVRDSPRAASY
jgi:uncharacterized protein (TIGR02145 family)